MSREELYENPLMKCGEVAALFRVDNRTVVRWADQGKITSVRTLGGHRRYLASSVYAALAQARREGGA